jgi:NAD(P)H-quinone oxidoreductase subunit 5
MLFLGSGSVIHGMEGVVGHNPALAQDMRMMGGLRKYMPVTATTFLIGCLAISGMPPFAGFWSKDEILGSAYAANPALWVLGWLTAGITAFYMFRMYFTTFEGAFRGNNSEIKSELLEPLEMALPFGPGAMDPKELEHLEHNVRDPHDSHGHSHQDSPHESPLSMVLPLIVLAIPSILIGLLGTPFNNYFEAFIYPPSETAAEALKASTENDLPEFLVMAGNSVGISLIGITLASFMYLRHKVSPSAVANQIQPLYRLSLNKWYFDDIYNSVFVRGTRRLARQVLEVDYNVVDGAVNLTGFLAVITGEGLKYFESGRAQFYALIVFLAVLGFVIVAV